MNSKMLLLVFLFVVGTFDRALAVDAIKDNSFLIEEAYNQEAGVVQFVQTVQYHEPSEEWAYTLSVEVPVPDESHQLSFAIPLVKQDVRDSQLQPGDLLLNYRYQLFENEFVAIAPRFSLILPTGDHKKEYGSDVFGLQFNQSISVELTKDWATHWNLGFTYLPDAKNANDETAHLFGYNFGASVIYIASASTQVLFEFLSSSQEQVTAQDSKESVSSYYFAPGVRTAFKVGNETEIVPGIAALLGVGPSAVNHERGLFVYFSVESKLW